MFETIETSMDVNIKVVGVGGAGGNAVNHMIASQLSGVEFWAINTDAQALNHSKADKRLQIGQKLTRGRGVGGNPEVGFKAAEESRDELKKALEGAEMVFITAGMGGGTGTGAAPVVAEVARELGALTIGVVSRPFGFEGKMRERCAVVGIDRLMERVDTLIVIPNQRLVEESGNKVTFKDAFRMADDVLCQGVGGISDIITIPGHINVDFADIRTIMTNAGTALMGVGMASGEGRAVEATRVAVASPLLETSFRGATGVIFNIRGCQDELTMHEVNEALKIVHEEASDDANIIFGAVFDDNMAGQVHVTVIATGFASGAKAQASVAPAAVSTHIEAPHGSVIRHPAATPALAGHDNGPGSSADIPEFLRNIIRPR